MTAGPMVVPFSVLTPGAVPAMDLLARLHSLECQSLALAVVMWFDERPGWNTPFRLDIGHLEPDELSAVLRFSLSGGHPSARPPKERLEEARARIGLRSQLERLERDVSSRLETTIGSFAIELSTELNAITWDAASVRPVIGALLRRHAGVDPEDFFAQVAPAGSLWNEPMGDGEVLPPLIPNFSFGDLNEVRYSVSRLVLEHVALQLDRWFRARPEWSTPMVLGEVRQPGAAPLHRLLPATEGAEFSAEEAAAVLPIQNLLDRLRHPNGSSWMSSFVSAATRELNKVQWRPADYEWPLLAVMNATGLDPELLVKDRSLQELGTLEEQVSLAPGIPRPRI